MQTGEEEEQDEEELRALARHSSRSEVSPGREAVLSSWRRGRADTTLWRKKKKKSLA